MSPCPIRAKAKTVATISPVVPSAWIASQMSWRAMQVWLRARAQLSGAAAATTVAIAAISRATVPWRSRRERRPSVPTRSAE